MIRRRGIILTGVGLAAPALTFAPSAARAQDRPLRILSSAPPGGASDVVARLLAEGLQSALGQRVLVENRVGAGGVVAAEAAARAAPDGLTLFMGILSTQVLLPAQRRVPYDAEQGFAPIALISVAPMVLLLHPAVTARSVAELIVLSRERPGALNFSNGGVGTLPHLLHEMLARETGLLAQPVPYSGSATALAAAVNGETQGTFEVGVIARGQVAAGALRALAVTTRGRDPGFPEVPSFTELGYPRMVASSWTALLAPAGTPGPVLRQLNGRVAAVTAAPEFRARLAALGAEAQSGPPEALADFLVEERERWTSLARAFAPAMN
jgi:tripartite-type tricarboxylate transporter receptor subunit TctC